MSLSIRQTTTIFKVAQSMVMIETLDIDCHLASSYQILLNQLLLSLNRNLIFLLY